jgi:hypothetical protein
VECCLYRHSTCSYEKIRKALIQYLSTQQKPFTANTVFSVQDHPLLAQHVMYTTISDIEGNNHHHQVEFRIHIYQLFQEESDDVDDTTRIFTQITLPAVQFHGLWESLIYEDDMPERLLRYAMTAMHFSRLSINPHLITWNR